MSSIHPQARTAPKTRQEIKDYGNFHVFSWRVATRHGAVELFLARPDWFMINIGQAKKSPLR